MQQAVQEKFRQAGENLDNLNAWLDQVEREIASQEGISEDPESLKSQINAIKVNLISIKRELVYNYMQRWRGGGGSDIVHTCVTSFYEFYE